MNNKIQSEIIYFPYLFMKEDEIDLGFAKVINLNSDLSKYCSDQVTISYVKDLLKAFYKGNHFPIKGIGLLKFKDVNLFEPVPNLTTEIIDEVKNILFLSTLSLSNTSDRNNFAGWSAISSDNFDHFIQPFIVGEEGFSSRDGFIVTKTVGGYKVGKQYFKIPEYVLEPSYNIDHDLLNELLWLKNNSNIIYKKFVRSASLVYQSSSNNLRFSINSRILLMASAFEVLLRIPSNQQRNYFRNKIEKLTGNPNDRTISFWSSRAPYNTSIRRTGNVQKWWADNFYTLRNKIAHGNSMSNSDYVFRNHQRHFDISVLMYLISLKRLINRRKKTTIFFDIIFWDKHSDGNNIYQGFRYDNRLIDKAISEGLI